MDQENECAYSARTERINDSDWRAAVDFEWDEDSDKQSRRMATYYLPGVFPTHEDALAAATRYAIERINEGNVKF